MIKNAIKMAMIIQSKMKVNYIIKQRECALLGSAKILCEILKNEMAGRIEWAGQEET